jgi:hypothetical protein
MKNPHAVALGRLGGTKGGPARAKALGAKRRREIAQKAGLARSRALSPADRQALALRAAAARWADRPAILTAADAPVTVRRLLKSYDVTALKWAESDHRYAIVRAILVKGDAQAARWLRKALRPTEVRELVQRYRGAGCNEPERQKLRKQLRLTVNDIPERPYLGFQWPTHV